MTEDDPVTCAAQQAAVQAGMPHDLSRLSFRLLQPDERDLFVRAFRQGAQWQLDQLDAEWDEWKKYLIDRRQHRTQIQDHTRGDVDTLLEGSCTAATVNAESHPRGKS